MAYKCGNTGKEFLTRKEWLDHLCAMNSPILEGEERDVNYCKKKMQEKADKGDVKAKEIMKAYNMED